MTCDDCQAILIDIARGVDIDRATREDARRHAALCARCREQQQEQQWLTTQLRAVATAAAAHDAPPRVESAVLAAWRATRAAAAAASPSTIAAMTPAGAPTATPTPTPTTTPTRSTAVWASAWKSWTIPGVAIAGLAAAAMAMVIVWPSARETSNAPAPASASAPRVAALHSGNTSETAGTRAPLDNNKQGRGDNVPAAAAEASAIAARENPAKSAEEPSPASDPGERMMRARARVDAVLALATVQDAAFLPLPYAAPLRATEVRHVVRVSMMSGDEMLLGMLPADRRSGQPFEAEVLVGEDGIARAIRIVQ